MNHYKLIWAPTGQFIGATFHKPAPIRPVRKPAGFFARLFALIF